MARRFNVQGTNDFLVWAVLLLVLGLWCVKDGWFPSQTVLDKHPHEILIKAEQDSTVAEVFVKNGELIRPEQPIARLTESGKKEDRILKGTLVPGSHENFQVNAVLAGKGEVVKAGQVVVNLSPNDTFYTFNHTLAFLALLGSLICAVIHFLVR